LVPRQLCACHRKQGAGRTLAHSSVLTKSHWQCVVRCLIWPQAIAAILMHTCWQSCEPSCSCTPGKWKHDKSALGSKSASGAMYAARTFRSQPKRQQLPHWSCVCCGKSKLSTAYTRPMTLADSLANSRAIQWYWDGFLCSRSILYASLSSWNSSSKPAGVTADRNALNFSRPKMVYQSINQFTFPVFRGVNRQ